MWKKELAWAHGTDPECKMAIGRLLKPGEILGLYQRARAAFGTGDLVLLVTDDGPCIMTRSKCVENLKRSLGARALEFTMAHESAHKVVQLPVEDDAMWVVVDMTNQFVPPTVVFAIPYEIFDNPSDSAVS